MIIIINYDNLKALFSLKYKHLKKLEAFLKSHIYTFQWEIIFIFVHEEKHKCVFFSQNNNVT